MSRLAHDLWEKHGQELDITYLTYKGSTIPVHETSLENENYPAVIYHDGFHDYMEKVIELAPKMDCIILGAAVANLIPVKPFPGKFPSHNYKPGDIIPIDFTIAPCVIDEVKKDNPKATLYGFKLLFNVPHEELIRAAYEVCIDSKAAAVFANDAANLSAKYAVTKERSIIPLDLAGYTDFIWNGINDQYYSTQYGDFEMPFNEFSQKVLIFNQYRDRFQDKFKKIGEYVFGTIAVRLTRTVFLTTARGKNELSQTCIVLGADHINHKVTVLTGGPKATLDAALLSCIFMENRNVDVIVHFHEQIPDLMTIPYAPPGTVREATGVPLTSFRMEHHGSYLYFDEEGRRI